MSDSNPIFKYQSWFQTDHLNQGSPTPRPCTGTGLRPVRNWATQQEVSGGLVNKASSAAPHRSPSLALPPELSPLPIHGKIVFQETSP